MFFLHSVSTIKEIHSTLRDTGKEGSDELKAISDEQTA